MGDIRSKEQAAGLAEMEIDVPVSTIAADAGNIDILPSIPAGEAYEVTGVSMFVMSLLSANPHLIGLTDGTSKIIADQMVTPAHPIGFALTPTPVAPYKVLSGTDLLRIVSTTLGSATGLVLVRISLKKVTNNA